MTVRDVIEALQKEHPDRLVILSSDSEGNHFSPLDEVSPAAYRPTGNLNGEIGLERLSKEAKKAGYSEEDVIRDGVPALVLYPMN